MNTAEKLLKITEVLPEVINTKVPLKVRRGQVHSGICRILQIPNSNRNVKIIKAVLEATGIREVVIRGRMFYVSYPDANPANKAKVLAQKADKDI